MAEYTYTFIDIRSQEKLGALPLYGVNCSDLLSRGAGGASAGTFTGSIRMDSDFVQSPQEILDLTRPEATMVWMEYDETPLWCGILWTRTYQSDGRVLQLNAQTFPSYLSSVVWDPEDPAVLTKQVDEWAPNIVRYLWQYLISEAAPEYNVGVHLEEYHAELADVSKFMHVTFDRAERKYLQEYAEEALKVGAEYKIVPSIIDGQRVPVFQSGYPNTLGLTQNAADLGVPLQYPGDMSKYWLTNSAANAPTKVIGVGKTSGQDDIVTVGQISTTGRIGVDKVISYDTGDLVTLTNLVASDQEAAQADLTRPVYEVAGGNIDLSWRLGDYRRVVIDDPYRFPGPVGGSVRLVGWSLSPPSSGGTAQFGITVSNTSNLVALNV